MFRLFEPFLKKMQAAFRRIARATKGELTAEELHSDAWLAAHEIGERRGREIDFSNPDDQRVVLGAVYIRNVKRPEKNMRYASSLDEPREGEDGNERPWLDALQTEEAADPLTTLLLRESAPNEREMLASSYSQAAAYVMFFVRFKNNREKVCAYLVISNGTLAKRVNDAAQTVRAQPSLFDGIERIRKDFMPMPGRQYAARIERRSTAEQWRWEF